MRTRANLFMLGLFIVATAWVGTPHTAFGQSEKAALEAYNKGLDLRGGGKYAEARTALETALGLYRQLQGEDSLDVADCCGELGNVISDMGEYAKAEPLLRRSLDIREAKLGKDHPDTAQALNNLALLYRDMGQYAKAEPLYRRCLDIQEAKLGKDHPETATSLNNLGSLYRDTGQYAKAEPLLRRSLDIREAKLGKDHPDTAQALNNLALLYCDMGQYAKAEPLTRRCLDIQEAKLGKDHRDTATSLNNLALLYRDMGQYAKAEPLYRRCLDIDEAKLGKDHPDTALALNNLGSLYRDTGQYAKAEPLLRRCLDIQEAKLGKDHPDTATSLNNLALLYRDMGEYAKAEPLYRRCLGIREAKLGKDHPSTATSLNNLAGLYRAMGQYAKAEPLCRRSLDIREGKLGKDHPSTATSLNSLGSLYTTIGQYAKAEPLLTQSVDIYKARLGRSHPYVRSALGALATLYIQTQRPQEAIRLFDQARRIARSHQVAVLPILSDGEQLSFLQRDLKGLYRALSLARSHSEQADTCRRAAGWLLNAKAAAQEAVAERVLLARDNLDPAAAAPLRELVAIRQEIAKLSLSGNTPGKEEAHAQRLRELTDQEKQLSTRLHVPENRLTREDPWVDVDDFQRRMPNDSIFVDVVRTPICDFQAKKDNWQPARYLALLTPKRGEVQFVDLGPADAIDEAVTTARKALEASRAAIRQHGEIEAEKTAKAALQKLAQLVLEPLRPHLNAHPRWILCPDGNLWLVPWAALPLDANTYAVEKHQIQYVSSGRDLLLNPLKLDHKTSAPAIFADPEFDLAPAEVARETDALRGGGPGGLELLLHARRLPGRIGEWNVSFELQADGRVLIRDEDAKSEIVGQGTWSVQAQQLAMQTKYARFQGTVQAGRIAGERARQNDDGTTTRDSWSLTLPAEQSPLSLAFFDVRAPRQLGKVQRLPGTAAEAEAIAPTLSKYAGIAVKRYMERQATVGVFQSLKSPKVLVLSTHGFFLPDQHDKPVAGFESGPGDKARIIPGLENPLLRCGLLLAGSNHAQTTTEGAQTGILTGLEIVGTDLRGTELVVLSACETGLGEVRNGEGVAGLRQAFQIAGAETVMATLWQIPDQATALLMKRVFDNLAQGQTRAEALRNAQLDFLRQQRELRGAAHPFYWAAFTVTGR